MKCQQATARAGENDGRQQKKGSGPAFSLCLCGSWTEASGDYSVCYLNIPLLLLIGGLIFPSDPVAARRNAALKMRVYIWANPGHLHPHSFIKISGVVRVSGNRVRAVQSSLHVYSVYMGITRVNEQASWDNKSVLMVLISQNTYIDVDSTELYGRPIAIRVMTL